MIERPDGTTLILISENQSVLDPVANGDVEVILLSLGTEIEGLDVLVSALLW